MIKPDSSRLTRKFAAAALALPLLLAAIPSRAETIKLKVMTFNIYEGAKEDKAGVSERWKQIIKAIQISGADIIAVQEALLQHSDTFEKIADELGFHRYHMSVPGINYRDNGIYSRFPIIETYTFWPKSYATGLVGAKIRIAPGREIMVFGTHLVYNSEKGRLNEMTMALDRIDELTDPKMPVVFMGDLNAVSDGDAKEQVVALAEQRRFIDLYRRFHPDSRREPGYTYSPYYPEMKLRRLDYILTRGPLRPLSCEVLDKDNCVDPWGSDHKAVIAEIEIDIPTVKKQK